MKFLWSCIIPLILFVASSNLHAESPVFPDQNAASLEVLVAGKLSGSGWIATPDGLAITAAHVVKSAGPVEVLTIDGKRISVQLLALDMGHDLALLKLERRHGFFPYLPVSVHSSRTSDRLQLVGSPLFRHRLTLPGQIASERLHYEWNERNQCYTEILPVAAMTPDGVSGAAWCDTKGRVVGMQSGMMLYRGALQGIAFMTPGKFISRLLKARKDASSNWLGANIAEGWEVSGTNKGLLVTRVLANGPADRAGLKRGDRILSLNNQPLTYRDNLIRRMRELPTGGPASLEILRNGRKLQLKLPLQAREKN